MDDFPVPDKKIEEGFLGQRMIVLPPDTLETISLNNLIKNFFVTAIGFYPNAVYHNRERKRGSKEYILLYCTKGRGNIDIGGKKQELIPNSFIIIPPLEPHQYSSLPGDPWSIYWVHFTGPNATELYYRYCFKDTPEVKSIPFDENRTENFNEIMNFLEVNFSIRNLEIINIKVFHFISSFIYDQGFRPSTSEATTITHSIAFMKNEIDKSLKIKELASQQNLSVSRYSELFKEKTGISPVKYFIQMKIQKSCQYLYFTDLSIKEICCKVGFDDPYYFSRMFKKLMGIAPSNYRRQYKN